MQVYLCNLRQTIKSLKARELHLSDNLIYSFKDENKSEFMNCMQEQIRSKFG